MPSNDLTVTLIQTGLYWEDKAANLQMLQQKINGISQKTEVVVLPEMFSTGFTMNNAALAETMDGTTVLWMKEIAEKYKIILIGSIIASPSNPLPEGKGEQEAGYRNRLIWMLPNGQYGVYDKRHLFGFAGEDQYYTAGNKRLIASVKGWKINLQICYDLRFPVWARQAPPPPTPAGEGETSHVEYDVLINIANWPKRRNTAWKTLLQARAIENQSFVIGVNRVGIDGNGVAYNGDSMVVGPLGEILYHKEINEDVFTITLQKEALNDSRNKFPFLKDGDRFVIY